MPPLEAERQGYERVNKYPKSTKFGRQNPITARWNSDEQLVVWRENWAQTTNKYLDEANRSDAHIDHRSHAARGIDEQPTIHEGYLAQAMESRGLIADRCEINRQIKADNALLRELKAAFAKISQAVKNTVPTLAKAMESLREKGIVIYNFMTIDNRFSGFNNICFGPAVTISAGIDQKGKTPTVRYTLQ